MYGDNEDELQDHSISQVHYLPLFWLPTQPKLSAED